MNGKDKVGIISLGCSKNLVDSEYILAALHESGYRVVPESNADVVIINTCGFIQPAVKESESVISEVLKRKQEGGCKKVVVAGCLPSREHDLLKKRFPGVDYFVNSQDILLIPYILNGKGVSAGCGGMHGTYENISRMLTNTAPFTYVKISEGCSNRCSYCTIPLIKGPLKSRGIEAIVREVELLSEDGILEVNLISQDTTAYGIDARIPSGLEKLLKRLDKVKGIKWIRLLYCYPSNFTDGLIKTIRDSEKVCKYLDIPIQHINNKILERMNRRTKRADIEKLLDRLKKYIPGLTLRTTCIVGFPGEGEGEFRELYNFIKEFRFDRMGAFKYSPEEGTPACMMEGHLSEEKKEERYAMLMELQRDISLDKNEAEVRTKKTVLIEGFDYEKGLYFGRVPSQAPEVDGRTIIQNQNAGPGKMLDVMIVDATPYDLIAEPA